MTEQNESRTEESKANEVIIVKRRTLTNCQEYVSIQLKSSDEDIKGLLKKAINATELSSMTNDDKKLGIS
jgi:hypothetical protein